MNIAVYIIYFGGFLIHNCVADLFYDREFGNHDRRIDFEKDRNIEHSSYRDRHRDDNYDSNNRNRDPHTLFCKDLNPQSQLDIEHVSIPIYMLIVNFM